MTQQVIAKGSMLDVAQRQNRSVAEVLKDAKLIVLVDTSGSMNTLDAQIQVNDKPQVASRDVAARAMLEDWQYKLEGKIMLAHFGTSANFVPGGVLPPPDGDTYMLRGLDLVQRFAKLGVKVLLISDGIPNENEEHIKIFVKQNFVGRLDTAYIGRPGTHGSEFMRELAAIAQGQFQPDLIKHVKQLTARVVELIAAPK